MKQDTICAIATAQGGAIGLIRVTGSDAIRITDRIFTPVGTNPSPLSERKPYTLSFGHVCNEAGEIIDEVLVSLFRSPHSYTGEDSTEISCHGSSYILNQIMQLLIRNGCRSAGPGEFTQRAFLAGKMDLSQAEAVADLIASSSAATHKLAMSQMKGGFSCQLKELRNQLLHLTSLIELELDFSDHEEVEFADRSELERLTNQIEQVISHLVQSFSVGNAIKNGIPVAIVGEANAGKSTLLNVLLGEDKAIVSDIPGTTRDIIEDTMNLNGVTFRFIDTAGIRLTTDYIETIGIERSYKAIDKAQIVILMYDLECGEDSFYAFYEKVHKSLKGKQVVLAMNKCDVVNDIPSSLPSCIQTDDAYWHSIAISAHAGFHIEQLRSLLVEIAALPDISVNDVIVTNVRHYEALTHSLEAIRCVQEGLITGLSSDLISQNLRECVFYLSDIVGEVTTDEVLGNIFKHFCIGK